MLDCPARLFDCGCIKCRADIIPPRQSTRALTVTLWISIAATIGFGAVAGAYAVERVNKAYEQERV